MLVPRCLNKPTCLADMSTLFRDAQADIVPHAVVQAEPASSIELLASIALKTYGAPSQPVRSTFLEEFSARRCPRLSCGCLPSEAHSLPRLRVLDLTGEAVSQVSCTAPAPQSFAYAELIGTFNSKHRGCCPLFSAMWTFLLPCQCGSPSQADPTSPAMSQVLGQPRAKDMWTSVPCGRRPLRWRGCNSTICQGRLAGSH